MATLEKRERPAGAGVPCPECGELFSPRGLASHRRHRHGGRQDAAEPPAPFASKSPAAARQAPDPAVLGALEQLSEAVAGLGERLERLEVWMATGAAASTPSVGGGEEKGEDEVAALRAELDDVLRAIATENDVHGGMVRYDHEATRTLGSLRRRQYALLLRLGRNAPGVSVDEHGQPIGLY